MIQIPAMNCSPQFRASMFSSFLNAIKAPSESTPVVAVENDPDPLFSQAIRGPQSLDISDHYDTSMPSAFSDLSLVRSEQYPNSPSQYHADYAKLD
jgi:hypothetical protein